MNIYRYITKSNLNYTGKVYFTLTACLELAMKLDNPYDSNF